MKLTLPSALFFFALGFSFSSLASEAGRQFGEADAALNAAYKEFTETITDPKQRELFTEGETAWMKYRDANVASFSARYPESKGGLFLKTRLTRERTLYFKSLLATTPEADPVGSAVVDDSSPPNSPPPQPPVASSSEAAQANTPAPTPAPPPTVLVTPADFDKKSVEIITGLFHQRGDSWFANCRFNEYRDVTEMKGVKFTVNINPIGEAEKLNGVDWSADYYVQCKALRQAFRQLPTPLPHWGDWQDEEQQKVPVFHFNVTHRNGNWNIAPQMRDMTGEYTDYRLIPPQMEKLPEYGEAGAQKLADLIAQAKRPTKTIASFPFTKYDYYGTTHGSGTAKITDIGLFLTFDDTNQGKKADVSLWYAIFWDVVRQQLGNDDGPWAQFTALDPGQSGSSYNLHFATMKERDSFCSALATAIAEWKAKYPMLRQATFRGLRTEH